MKETRDGEGGEKQQDMNLCLDILWTCLEPSEAWNSNISSIACGGVIVTKSGDGRKPFLAARSSATSYLKNGADIFSTDYVV